MINFISNVDSRLSDFNISLDKALKLRNYHDQVYGQFKCYIEQDGVEITD
jgi:hypothetical protein